MVGDYNSELIVARFNLNGSIDNSFGLSGVVNTNVQQMVYASSLVIQSDGKIVVTGFTTIGYRKYFDFAVVRYNKNGTLDNTFSDDRKSNNKYW